MKLLIQNYCSGELQLVEVPEYCPKSNMITVQTEASLVSIGTEKAMIEVAKKSLLGKALARPDWVKQVIDKIKTEGLMEAYRQSKARLDMPVPLGYSCAGIVKEVNNVYDDFRVGDRVACAGSGYASHSECNVIPPNLCTRIPKNVSFEDAAYVAIGGIAMEAVRLARVELGYKVGVIGLGLLGQLAIQILRAAGCHVVGFDISERKCELALQYGAETAAVIGKDDSLSTAKEFSDHEGLDAVIILASTKSNEPLALSADMCRERGRIIAGGLVGLEIPRDQFYRKELDFAVSRAWGPGIYDPDYEERNLKYPLPYARWTAKRNMEEFLRMVSLGSVKLNHLTTHRISFEKALEAYDLILQEREPTIGVILTYNQKTASDVSASKRQMLMPIASVSQEKSSRTLKTDIVGIGLIGAGLYAKGTLLPVLAKFNGIRLEGVATASGLSGKHIADKFKFNYSTTDYEEILVDPNVDLVFILTRHNTHAKFVCEALKAGKAVFVEKPLCINEEQLKEIIDVYSSLIALCSLPPFLMVGFNRRFSPATKKCIDFICQNDKLSIVQIRCNAGFIPSDSWVHKKDEGGGRIIGEVCHFVDLAQTITGGLPKKVFASCTNDAQGLRDNIVVSLQMDNGSAVSIVYASNGDKSFPREKVEVFAMSSICVIENFKNITFVSSGKKKTNKSLEVDRGYTNEIRAMIDALRNGNPPPIDFRSVIATTLATFAIENSISRGEALEINLREWGIN